MLYTHTTSLIAMQGHQNHNQSSRNNCNIHSSDELVQVYNIFGQIVKDFSYLNVVIGKLNFKLQ